MTVRHHQRLPCRAVPRFPGYLEIVGRFDRYRKRVTQSDGNVNESPRLGVGLWQRQVKRIAKPRLFTERIKVFTQIKCRAVGKRTRWQQHVTRRRYLSHD